MTDPRIVGAVPFPPAWAAEWGGDSGGRFASLKVGEVSLEMRWVREGTFTMGTDPKKDQHGDSDETPAHGVEIARGFWLGRHPVTQAQYEAVIGERPGHFKGPDRPAESIDWHQACAFCARLTEMTRGAGCLPAGWVFRLPTEAEWEYACRAGTTTAFNDGSSCTNPSGKDPALDRLGWYGENSDKETHPVGEKPANAWGLQDMHGNVWEWCLDGKREYSRDPQTDPLGPTDESAGRVVRGGSYWFSARGCRSAARGRLVPGFRLWLLGFRLAAGRELETSKQEGRRAEGAEPRGRGTRPPPGGLAEKSDRGQ